jgi:hypothetical protein
MLGRLRTDKTAATLMSATATMPSSAFGFTASHVRRAEQALPATIG